MHCLVTQQPILALLSLPPQFLEGGHITQLAHYLEALNESSVATSDHLILLLNCYSRLQDKAKINQFVEVSPNEKGFDVWIFCCCFYCYCPIPSLPYDG